MAEIPSGPTGLCFRMAPPKRADQVRVVLESEATAEIIIIVEMTPVEARELAAQLIHRAGPG